MVALVCVTSSLKSELYFSIEKFKSVEDFIHFCEHYKVLHAHLFNQKSGELITSRFCS